MSDLIQDKTLNFSKEIFQQQRQESYSYWPFALFREGIQNSSDARSKQIDIDVEEAKGRGYWGSIPDVSDIVRVKIADDGTGMSKDVIDNIFFDIGKSSKNNTDSVGGFGTARLMLCFSHLRYAIHTLDWVVEGSGIKYTSEKIDDTLKIAKNLSERINTIEMPEDKRKLLLENVSSYQTQLAQYKTVGRGGKRKGTLFEIDIDPNEHNRFGHYKPTKNTLLNALNVYLSMSNLSARVVVNGNPVTSGLKAGRVRRTLETVIGGEEQTFAKVYTSDRKDAPHRGKLIVRVNGAPMFYEHTSNENQIIVEIDPKLSKFVLNEKRDGLRSPHHSILYNFCQDLAANSKSALENQDKSRHIVLSGEKGTRLSAADMRNIASIDYSARKVVIVKTQGAEEEQTDNVRLLQAEASIDELQGASELAVEGLIDAVKRGEKTFLENFDDRAVVKEIVTAINNGSGKTAFQGQSSELAKFVVQELNERLEEAGISASKIKEGSRLPGINDMHIHINDFGDTPEQTRAPNRYNPKYWRQTGGAQPPVGMGPHMLWTAFTVFCDQAIKARQIVDPGFAKETIEWTTGFDFEKSQTVYVRGETVQDQKRGDYREVDGVHVFSLNPVFDDGKRAFDLNKARRTGVPEKAGRPELFSIQDIHHIALQQVARIKSPKQDENFASLLTSMSGVYDMAGANHKMQRALAPLAVAYGTGRARVQAMDVPEPEIGLDAQAENVEQNNVVVVVELEQNGEIAPVKRGRGRPRKIRPAEALLAAATPASTMLAGATFSSENSAVEAGDFQDKFEKVTSIIEPGVVEINCENAQELEAKVMKEIKKNPGEQPNLQIIGASDNQETVDLDVFDEQVPDLDTNSGPMSMSDANAESIQQLMQNLSTLPVDKDAKVSNYHATQEDASYPHPTEQEVKQWNDMIDLDLFDLEDTKAFNQTQPRAERSARTPKDKDKEQTQTQANNDGLSALDRFYASLASDPTLTVVAEPVASVEAHKSDLVEDELDIDLELPSARI